MIAFSDLAVGHELPELSVQITRADLVRYAGASGDFNPIHWNERFATSVGLPDVIAHGMFTMAQAGRLLTSWIGDAATVLDYGVRFTRPVVVSDAHGATLVLKGKVRSISEDATVTIDLNASVGGQTVLAKAQAVVRFVTPDPVVADNQLAAG